MKVLACFVCGILSVHMAQCADLSDLLKPEINGLFDIQLGERIPESEQVVSGADGMLVGVIEPNKPLLPFETFAKTALPKTRSVVVIQGVTTFGEKEQIASQVYEKYSKVIREKYKRSAKDVPGTPCISGGELKIKQLGVMGKRERFLCLELVKLDSEGYVVRLQLTDMMAIQNIAEKARKAMDAKIEGIFGVKFGEIITGAVERHPSGLLVSAFEPQSKFCGFTDFIKIALPKTRRVCRVIAVRACPDAASAEACFDRVKDLFYKKYGRRMADTTGGCVASEPDEDGEILVKQGHIAFAGQRNLLLSYYKTPANGALMVRVIAEDSVLGNLLQQENNELQKAEEKSDLNAL